MLAHHPRKPNQAVFNERSLNNLRDVTAPHIQAFSYAVTDGFAQLRLPTLEFALPGEDDVSHRIKLTYDSGSIALGAPTVDEGKQPLFPRECRERGMDYGAEMYGDLLYSVDRSPMNRLRVSFGEAPIMVCSNKCRLHNLSPEKLIQAGEDASEMGGYFIASGNERLLRYFQLPRRNYPHALVRASNKKFGEGYTEYAVQMRCVSADQTSSTITLHYARDGTSYLRLRIRKIEYFLPLGLILRSLVNASQNKQVTDEELFSRLCRGDEFIESRVELELRKASERGWKRAEQCLAYIGSQFRDRLLFLPLDATDEDAGVLFMERFVFIHLDDFWSKLDCLIEMARKLYELVRGAVGQDDPDALHSHELLMGGHFYLQITKELLEESLLGIQQDLETSFAKKGFNRANALQNIGTRLGVLAARYGNVGRKLFSVLATGSIQFSRSGLDMSQTAGFSIIVDKLNRLRYLSHFQSVHRGTFFAEMKTTIGRKLLPESWGFLCPVHTPDGAPCGLLNHMAQLACPVPSPQFHLELGLKNLSLLLTKWGVLPVLSCGGSGICPPNSYLPVMVDGVVVGHGSPDTLQRCAKRLRQSKAKLLKGILSRHFPTYKFGDPDFPTARVLAKVAMERSVSIQATDLETRAVCPTMEVVYFPRMPDSRTSPYPGLFILTEPARLVRPVIQVQTGLVELIGPLQQTFLKIAVSKFEVDPALDEYVEIDSAASVLSLVASLTPFSDFNQSPRNMYQCQMGKQSMGTPAHALPMRADNKLYRLQNVQFPLVQTRAQTTFAIDEYPNGCNAVVAVISYTGYDMEDAMILNKGSLERGFGHASVYTTVEILTEQADEWITNEGKHEPRLDRDGLPHVGQRLTEGSPLACIWNDTTKRHRVELFKDKEPAVVLRVKITPLNTSSRTVSSGKARTTLTQQPGIRRALLTLRYDRNPTIGDKFSSRHGQKGVLSVAWPQQDMPFSESGITPDVIINPHAFPSRMTIGMLVESMAGKASALHGYAHDATPFTMQGDDTGRMAVDYFGSQLRDAGYSYYGSEPMYSGVLGCELHCDIYLGVVYYQRLRHMVLDKAQVRATGPVDVVTRQPIHGRKRNGGVRFGEMERDSLVAHGAAFLTQDRLLNCSDRHTAHVCCGSLLSAHVTHLASGGIVGGGDPAASNGEPVKQHVRCRMCGRSDRYKLMTVPYAFRYLTNELAAMGIRLEFDV